MAELLFWKQTGTSVPEGNANLRHTNAGNNVRGYTKGKRPLNGGIQKVNKGN
jgi:hypothetical protein